ncbi:hypothetical protein ACE6H2_015046 [Prunus campanulata]
MASSASSTPTIWTHDAFLSFRGEDTRTSFTDHLYHALIQRGIRTFRDEENLKRGKSIGPVLLKAIEECRFAVIILSEDYASSGWCLDELAHIVECKKEKELEIFPVFYHIKPSDLGNQTGKFSEAFAKHEENFKGNMEKVDKWRKALGEIAAIWGWVLDKDSKEAEVTQAIAEKISTILHCMPSFSEDLIGMGPRMEKMESLLDLKERDDVRTIGIWGMGGIGKTTLAELVYNKIRDQFQTSHFLHDVREESEKQGLVSLQNVLFKKLLQGSGNDIHNVLMGMSSLKTRLRTKKVLIVLDDVDHQKQIQALVGNDWLGRGSRVIITTRNEQLLKAYGAHHIFEVEKLNDEEAFQLFCKKAFKKGHEMADDYSKLSKGFAKYSNGLPLALEVLGGALCGKMVAEWESKFAKLKEYPDDKDIFPALQISYDGLEETEKQIFLDIACFFKGEDHNRVHKILDACNFHPTIGISVLKDKCLVKINKGNRLWMHDLLQQMGWSIVLGESSEPGKRSRLRVSENVLEYKNSRSWNDVNTVLEDNLGTNSVHGIFLTLPAKEEIELDADPFSNMRGLKLLKICNANFSECPGYFSRQLRLLEWHEYPLESLPPSFRPSSLVELRLPNSRIKQLWHEMRLPMMGKLTLIDLSNCKCLTKTPDFSKIPNLMGLTLEGCEKLSELHPTIWDLQHLVTLNLKGCECLESLPHSICLESLQNFVLSGCSRLERFPEIVGNMGHLSELHLDGTGVRELPLSIEHLTGLILLNLRESKNLSSVPSIICSLASLEYLYLSGCSRIDQLPENIGNLELLKELDACQTAITRLPLSILLLKNLQRLCLFGCTGLQLPHSFLGLSSLVYLNLSECDLGEGAIPDDIGICLSSLRSLGLSENNFESIPESISQLSELRELTLFKCCNLRLLPKRLPQSLKRLDARGCTSQTNYPKALNVWTSDEGIYFIDCRESEGVEDEIIHYPLPFPEEHLEQLFPKFFEDLIDRQQELQIRVPYGRIPDWCSEYSSGTSVTIQLLDPEDSNSWMGVALFVFFEILEKSSEMEETFCLFQALDGRLQNRRVLGNFENFIVGSHAVCCYEPARKFAGNLKKPSEGVLRASVSTNRSSLKVKGCGIRLISHQDAAKFAHDLSHTANQHLNSNFGPHCKYIIDEAMKLESSGDVVELDHHLRELPSTSTVNQGSSSGSSTTASTDSSIQPVQSLLSKLYEGHNGRKKDLFFSFRHEVVIPNWFNNHYLGNVALCDLPQNLFDESRWVGLELYVIFSWRHSISSLFHLPSFLCVDLCDQESSRIPRCVEINNPFPPFPQKVTRSHELVVLHVPRVYFQQHVWSQCQVIRAFFRTTNSAVEVELCGARLVYEEDLGGLIHSLTELTLGRSDMLDELCAYAQAFSAQTMENRLQQEDKTMRNNNAEEREMPIAPDSMGIQRQRLAESGQEFLIPEQDFTSILHKYRCYLKRKHDVEDCGEVIIVHSKRLTFDNRDSTQQKVAEEDAPPPLSLLVGHVHVLAETQLYGSYSPAKWKRYLQAYLQKSLVATLSLKGDKISVFKHFDPQNIYNFCFPRKECLEFFKGWTTRSSMIGIQLPPKLYDSGDWRGLAIISSFSVHEHPTATLEDLGSQITVKLLCHLRMGEYCLNPVAMCSITKEKFKWLHVRGFIWVTYIPRVLLSEFSAANSDIVEARIYSHCPALTVHECGIRLLYEKEVEEFKQTISQSWTSFFDDVDLIHQFVEGVGN